MATGAWKTAVRDPADVPAMATAASDAGVRAIQKVGRQVGVVMTHLELQDKHSEGVELCVDVLDILADIKSIYLAGVEPLETDALKRAEARALARQSRADIVKSSRGTDRQVERR